MKTDWDQVDLRNVCDSDESEALLNEVNLSTVIGDCCGKPLTCDIPFLVDLTERINDQSIMDIVETWSREVPGIKVAMRYSDACKFPGKLTSNCILEIDSTEIDSGILDGMEIGAFYVDIGKIYYRLAQYSPSITLGDNKNTQTRTVRKTKGTIDMNYSEDIPVEKWINSIRLLRPNIPFGIRLPANYIERDCVFASKHEIDFIILDCRDTSSRRNAVLPSMAAITRAKHIFSKLSCEGITVITGIPAEENFCLLKLFALGACMVLLPNQQEKSDLDEMEKHFSSPKEIAFKLAELKQGLYHCGCQNLKEIRKEHLITSSPVINRNTGISMVYSADPVVLPFYNIKRHSSRENTTEK